MRPFSIWVSIVYMKIYSWNVNGIRAVLKKGDFEKCQEYLDRANKITPGFVNPYLERHKKGLPIYPQDRPRQQPH